MTPKEQLTTLLTIQELALDIRKTNKILESAPGKIEEIEQRFRERNAEYVAVRDRYEALETDHRTRSGDLSTLEETKKKLMADLMEVKNQREYAAILKEIDTVKGQIAENEDAILRDMEEMEKLKGELATHEEHIAKEREAVAKERAEVESEEAEAKSNIDSLLSRRSDCEGQLPGEVARAVGRLENSRQGIFLSKADNGTCLSCFVRVRPQVFQEVKQAAKVHTCGSCKRFLYHEATLRPAPPAAEAAPPAESVAAEAAPAADSPAPPEAGEGGNVEAVNGGAV